MKFTTIQPSIKQKIQNFKLSLKKKKNITPWSERDEMKKRRTLKTDCASSTSVSSQKRNEKSIFGKKTLSQAEDHKHILQLGETLQTHQRI